MTQIHGRTPKPDGKTLGFTRPGKNSARVGEVFRRKDGQRYVVTTTDVSYVSSDYIEDMDAWAEYPDGPGHYTHYTAVPIEDTEAEKKADAAEAAEKQRKADEQAALKAREQAAWSDVEQPGYEAVETAGLPPGIPADLNWEKVSDDTGASKFGYGAKRYVATLPSGARVGRVDVRSMDDSRTHYRVPKNLADENHFQRAINLGRTLEENKRLAASTDYYKGEAEKFLAAYERATPERRAAYDKAADSAARVKAAPPDQQWAEVQRHYRDTGLKMDRLWMPDAARAYYDRQSYATQDELKDRVADGKVRALVANDPVTGRAKDDALYSGDQQKWESYLADAIPAAKAAVEEKREAKRKEWGEWFDARKPEIEAAVASVLPPELVSKGMDYVHWSTADAPDPISNDAYKQPAKWAEDIKELLSDADRDEETDSAHPELAAHGEKVRASAEAAKPKPKPRVKEVMHEVTGNTYPVKEKIKALGGRWKDGRWVIPASAAGRLPRGTSSRPI